MWGRGKYFVGRNGQRNKALSFLRAKVKNHPVVFTVISFIAASFVYSAIPDTSLFGLTVESVVLAILALVLVSLSAPETLRMPQQSARRPFLLIGIPVMVIALVGVIQNGANLIEASVSLPNDFIARGALIIVFCLTTGIFEEGLFRVIAVGSFVQSLSLRKPPLRHPLLIAAFASAAIFGFLHLSTGIDGALKPLQAGLFALIMSALYAQTRNLWPAAILHAFYNAVSMGPYLLLGDTAQSALLSEEIAIQVMLVSILLFLPLALFLLLKLSRMEHQHTTSS